ncbi:dual specificity protein phosphatase MPK-4-like [Daphnia carinata]|uniref:dual specificity protein phosphatase MPK-4-like n=1 Tax=Daphnia carinata TaxID=120202 RepID=UPI002579FD4A|nr:dual specificity protein phosphatase MPK-4-like [Daphnia carinata]
MDLIEEKLWIGGLSSALDKKLLRDHGITNIVTVDIKPLPPNGRLYYLFVPAHDVSNQDLFVCFESVFEFIEKGLKSGGVLVHCFHGVSRSATLVISYLQKKHKISTEEGLARLQAVRPSVMPNEGFMAQLRLYGVLMELNKMDSIVSRWYNLQQTANLHCGTPVAPPPGELSRQSTLKCKTCRYVLAYGEDVLYHRPEENPDWRDLSWVRFALSNQQIRIDSCRQAFFVIPPPWITASSAPQGKLLCPKCRCKIGAFSWNQNLKCPCAASYQPGFYFTPSKVDFIASK